MQTLGEHARHHDADVGALHLLHLLHRVPQHDVANLVRQDGRELVHHVRPLGHAPVHVDVAAREREGVEVVVFTM